MATTGVQGGGGQCGKGWDHMEKFRDRQLFDGNQKNFEEWAVKMRSVIEAGNVTVGSMLSAVEMECTEEVMQQPTGQFRQLAPAFDEDDSDFILETSAKLYTYC